MNSRIILCKNINLDRNYKNVLNYTEEQMLDLCEKNKVIEASNYSFIRSSVHMNSVLVDFSYEQCLQSNYIAFQNTNYSGKWFFAWIDDVIYRGDRNTQINFKVDSWSTWFSYWKVKPCYVIREHVNDDTIGKNTVPENIDSGEVIQEKELFDSSFKQTVQWYVGVMTDWTPKDGTDYGTENGVQFQGSNMIQGTIFGDRLLLFKLQWKTNESGQQFLDGIQNLSSYVFRTNLDGHIDDIKTMFIIPDFAFDEGDITAHTAKVGGTDFTFYIPKQTSNAKKINTNYTKSYTITGYTPKNNKCLVYPYYYIEVTNNQGSTNILRQENFANNSDSFETQFSVSVGCSARIVPKNYKGIESNYSESIALGKYPVVGWSSDAYTNWLTQNSVNNTIQIAETGASAVSSALSGNIASAVGSTASMIGNMIGSFYSAKLLPNISGTQATGDVAWTSDSNYFSIRFMHSKVEYMQIIDNYFSRFGYKIDRVKTPNLTGRQTWNYVEIAESDEIGFGSVPVQYMDEINNACRSGVTIWHNHDNIGNYYLNNNIVV